MTEPDPPAPPLVEVSFHSDQAERIRICKPVTQAQVRRLLPKMLLMGLVVGLVTFLLSTPDLGILAMAMTVGFSLYFTRNLATTWRDIAAAEEHRAVSTLGLDVRGHEVATFLPWSRMHRVVETDLAFIFMVSDEEFHFLPKRVLADHDLIAVRFFIHAHAAHKLVALPSPRP